MPRRVKKVEPSGVRRTDGRWDPTVRPMFFLAGDNPGGLNAALDGRAGDEALAGASARFRPSVPNLFAVNEFAEPGRKVNRGAMRWGFLPAIESGSPVFLDSGIFWLTNRHKRAHGITMDEALSLPPDEVDDFDWLFDTYVELCFEFRDRLWGYNELDQGGRACKITTRARVEALGLNPIPVYHPLNDGWDYFDQLAGGYDRICWGNVVQANRYVRARMVATLEERHRQYPDLWVHLLGYTPNDWLNGIPFDSCDSSTWAAFSRYPQAWRDRSMAKPATGFDGRYWYTPPMTNGLYAKAGGASVFTFDAVRLGLEDWRQRLRDEVGMVDFPEFTPGEAEPCPANPRG